MELSPSIPLVELKKAADRAPGLESEVVELFDELRGPLLRYLLSLGLAAQDGEEIVQEVFLALFQHLRKGGGRNNLRGWIFTVAHNQAIKLRQRAAAGPGIMNGGDTLDSEPNPEEQAVRNQHTRRVKAVISALPEQDRACLSLRAEGLRYREIAGVLGISLGAVALSLERSLARISRADGRRQ
ncbi:MAG: sigma-70 family RNA polymerase sigma factor [Bryobacteraceae bacterium]|nr:sigma-70 family RNA polymerase sigma factor [Bryobacteraceae bacterium]